MQVRFDNLRRTFRTSPRDKIQLEVRDSLVEFFHICELHKTPGATMASTRSLSTTNMALKCKLASSTPATQKICRRGQLQTSVDSVREPLVADDGDQSPSADESCGGSDDDAAELRSASGSPHWTSENVDTRIVVLGLPAAEREASDQEDARRSYDANSWAAPDRLRSRRPPLKAETSPAVTRGTRRRTLTYQ